MVIRTCAIFALVALLSACTTPSGTFCDIASPLRLSDTAIEAMSDAEVQNALAHNERGRRLCGWKPQG